MKSIYKWDRKDKLYAIEALHHSDQPDRGDYLLQLIVDDDPVVRGKVALAMEGLEDDKLLDAVNALLDEGETEYEILACELLGSTSSTDFSEIVEPLLESEDDRVVRSAIEVLDNLPDESCGNLVESVVDRYSTEWSKAIKRLLNRWHPPESFPLMKSLYPSVGEDFQAHLLRLAAATNHPDASDWVDNQLEASDLSEARKSVIRWLN